MKAKLGKLKQVETTQYNGFKSLLKKSVVAALKKPSDNNIIHYVMVEGTPLNWKCGGQVTDKPLLFLDENYNSLVKDVKAEKALDLKKYSYGSCKINQVGTNVTIYLCPEKGKLTQPALLKPLQKIFKGFKPKIYFEVVADLGTVEATPNNPELLEEQEAPSSTASSVMPKTAARAKAIGQNLVKYHQLFQAADKKVKALDAQNPTRTKLMVQRNQVLKHIKHLCTSWAEEISPQQDQLELEANWKKLYAYWSAFFAKRQAAKMGASTTEDAKKAAEERLYAKAAEDLERFFEDLEKGKIVDPSIIENDIQALETHLKKWQQFAKENSAFPEELKAMEEVLNNVKGEFKHAQQISTMSPEELQQVQKEGKHYAAAAEALELFMKDMETFDVTNPSKIEKDIASLEKHLADWKNAIGSNSSFYAKDLEAMEAALLRVKSDWAEAQPKLGRYTQVIEQLNFALSNNAPEEEIMNLINQAEAIVAA